MNVHTTNPLTRQTREFARVEVAEGTRLAFNAARKGWSTLITGKVIGINQGVDDFMNDLVTEQLVTIDNNKYTPTLEGTMIGNMKLAMAENNILNN